jgi:hypothetical protein
MLTYKEWLEEAIKFGSRKGYSGTFQSGKKFTYKHEYMNDTVTHSRMHKQNPHLSADESKEATKMLNKHMKKASSGEE